MEELLSNDELFNTVYQKLFNTFLSGITKRHKREYFSFKIGDKEFSGRAILPSVIVDEKKVEERALMVFRMIYKECKYYNDRLIKEMFPEMFEDIYQEILAEDTESNQEIVLDKFVDEILKTKLK